MVRSKPIRRVLALILVTVALMALAASPASAGPRLNCVANGQVLHAQQPDMTWHWGVFGAGPCLDGGNGPFFVTFQGVGSSDTLGLCDGTLLVQNLSIDVQLNVTNIRTGRQFVVHETWSAPITTYPLATPFLVGGGNNGVGAIASRLRLNCPPNGSPVATFVFDTTTKEG